MCIANPPYFSFPRGPSPSLPGYLVIQFFLCPFCSFRFLRRFPFVLLPWSAQFSRRLTSLTFLLIDTFFFPVFFLHLVKRFRCSLSPVMFRPLCMSSDSLLVLCFRRASPFLLLPCPSYAQLRSCLLDVLVSLPMTLF